MTLLAMTRGDKAVFAVAFTDADGVAIDLTGVSITFTAKRRATDSDVNAVIVKTTADGIAVNADPSTGLATLTLDAADTEDLDLYRSLYWDLQLDDLAGDVRTPLSGLLSISADMTHASGAS